MHAQEENQGVLMSQRCYEAFTTHPKESLDILQSFLVSMGDIQELENWPREAWKLFSTYT